MLYDLMTAIRDALQPAFAHPQFIIDQEPHGMGGVAIHIGQLPFKRQTEDQNDFPYLLIQPSTGEDQEHNSEATIRIHCGVFNNEAGAHPEAGAHDLVNMIDRVRRTIKALRFVGDGNRYELSLPIKWRFGESEQGHLQPLPMNEGVVIATWRRPSPVEVPDSQVQTALGMV